MKSSHEASQVGGLIEEGEAFRALSGRAVMPSRPAPRAFHIGISAAFVLTAFAGFAPTYYLKGITHAPPLSPQLHVHSAVFTGWLLLLFTQTAFVAARRVDLHRRLGI